MKTLISSLILMFSVFSLVYAQDDVVEGPHMEFESSTVDYGTIERNSDPIRTVKFTNTGTEPLIIKNAKSSCGCTVPTYPKEPVLPGESAELEINYKTSRMGKINKLVKITTNEGDEPHIVKVVGEVTRPAEEGSAPMKENVLGSDGE